MKKKLFIIIPLVIIVLIQFIQIDTKNPEVKIEEDYFNLTKAPKEIADILKASCYDCHSNESKYPYYSKIAPISWLVKNHINEGREHLNFSEWGTYSDEKKISKQEECIKEIEDNEMPLKSYTLMHSDANLTSVSKAKLVEWFKLQSVPL